MKPWQSFRRHGVKPRVCKRLGGHRMRYVGTFEGFKLITCTRCHASLFTYKGEGVDFDEMRERIGEDGLARIGAAITADAG